MAGNKHICVEGSGYLRRGRINQLTEQEKAPSARVFRRLGGERRVYFGLAENYLDSCCEEFGITKPSPKLVSLEKRYAELLKKGLTEAISPAAHERYRRTLGRLAWAALSRPDLQFVCGFLGRHQAGPNEAAESCMRDVLRWVKGLPHKVQVFPSSREILEEDADAEAISCFTDASWSLNSVSGEFSRGRIAR